MQEKCSYRNTDSDWLRRRRWNTCCVGSREKRYVTCTNPRDTEELVSRRPPLYKGAGGARLLKNVNFPRFIHSRIQRKKMARVPNCSTYGKAVGKDDRTLLCDLCETWENQCCVHEKERLTEELYASISACSSKIRYYVCVHALQK